MQNKEWYKKYYAKNRERKLANNKMWYAKNRIKILEKRRVKNSQNRELIAIKDKAYREKNREKILQRKREYYQKNREKIKAYIKEWYKKNQDKVKAWREKTKEYHAKYGKEYQKKNRKRLQEYKNNRSKNIPAFKLQKVLRARMLSALKRNSKKGSAIKDLGCTVEELKIHLEKQFQKGMTWKNHGLHGWHIDHIKPLASFDLTDKKQFIKAVHYTNLQPLWSQKNWSKGARN